MKKITAMIMALVLPASLLCSCGKSEPTNKNLDLKEPVTLTLCGPWTASKAVESASQAFHEKYPNCEIVYEYVQNYEESMTTRLSDTSDTVDLFLTDNLQEGAALLPYAENLFTHEELNISNTNEALIKNFTMMGTGTDDKPAEIYALPLGGELRGLYVNKTLLKSVGLEVPKNKDELLNACQVLKDAGYIPMNGNPGMFGQRLLYPYCCNLIANSDNYEETYNRVNSCEEGVSELFREPMEFLYTLTENGYYNYKYVETQLNMFNDNSDEGVAKDFFHIVADGDDFKKVDDLGTVAFMTGTLTQQPTLEKVKDDYHSTIDFEFILAPVSDDGGFAYISPAKGMAVGKNSTHKDWAVEFLNFLFEKENNTQYASDSNYIPNTTDSFKVIKEKFDVPDNHISDLGQATFDFGFYTIMEKALMDVSKGNNPKYMDTDKDGNPVMFSLDYYMEQLEAAFAEQR